MNQCFKIFTVIIIISVLFTPLPSFAVSDTTNVNLNVTGVICNNNGICEPWLGEDSSNCPSDCLVVPPVGGAPFSPDTTPPLIYNLFISKITLNSTEIFWETNEQALCQLFWGKTQEYKEEVISETAFYRKHSTKLTKLLPATTYHFKITCRDTSRNESETTDQKFTTLSPPDTTPPANVPNFEAIAGDSQITLSWQNPPDPDFKAVKIMRSEKFYPSDPSDGISVYDGKGTSFLDKGLKNGVRYYYTAFTYDKIGNYSSGAITSAVPQKPLPPEEIPPEILPPPEEIPPVIPPPPEIEKLTLKDFDFWQEDKKIPLEEGIKIKTETEKPLTISIPYESVPEVLKTIMVTLEKEGKFFSFLLRVNKEKTAYLSTLVPPEEAKVYPLTFTILDYKNQTLKKISGQLEVKKTEARPLSVPWYMKIINSVLNWLQSIWQAIKNIFTF